MENKICCTEEMEWNEDTKTHLHKICGWIKIFLISSLCVFGICGCHLYKLYGLDAAMENLSFLTLVAVANVIKTPSSKKILRKSDKKRMYDQYEKTDSFSAGADVAADWLRQIAAGANNHHHCFR